MPSNKILNKYNVYVDVKERNKKNIKTNYNKNTDQHKENTSSQKHNLHKLYIFKTEKKKKTPKYSTYLTYKINII